MIGSVCTKVHGKEIGGNGMNDCRKRAGLLSADVRKCLPLLICMIMIAAAALMINFKNAYAAERYISDVTVVKGEDGEESLIDKGYSVIHPYFLDGEKNQAWIGYKTTPTGTSAITDISADGVSNIKGVKDGSKSPVMAIYYMSADVNDVSKFTEVMPLANNGAVPARGSDGNIAVFETENGSGYICMIRTDVWESYIESVTYASGKTKKVAVKELCKKGCEYYIDANMSDGDTYTLIGYTRTSDKSKAITDIVGLDPDKAAPEGYEKIAAGSSDLKVKKKALYFTTDAKYGNPLVDIDFMEGFKKMELTGKQWSSLVIARGDNEITKPYILENAEYKAMAESEDAYLITKAMCNDDTDTGIILTCAKDGLKDKQKAKAKLPSVEVKEDEDEDTPDATEDMERVQYDNADEAAAPADSDNGAVENGGDEGTDENGNVEEGDTVDDNNDDGAAVDEGQADDAGITDDSEQADGEDTEGTGTVISAGSGRIPGMVEMIILIAVVILIPVVTIFIKRKIDKGSKKSA